ncbi:diacylglycerol/lipid kinase family protein [Haliangium ochraceum]|uniref:Diacylglycerol kinase catalytic region n=1 Tax=Haliangium ochraceum (strain DSM 14365 / JCM 11303 / SMP-2) TaxID=502025 RepID=D0LGX1_HALO1|nr:diacylglycerol kinase family protein [Haliangium ochraceum]ACY14693.1 diacylglycerol kinase catalytic region [Haliangium ochraceum DSM 14365]
MSHTVAVINPQSQQGALGRKWPDVARVLRRELGDFETAMTEAPEHATELTRAALRAGATRILAVGGDGTTSEVVGGFFEGRTAIAPEAVLGVIPFGTGGDFRRTVGLPKRWAQAVEALSGERVRDVDVGYLEYRTRDGAPASRVFINIASFGISGMVDRLVNESSKRLGGKLSFLVGSLRALMRYDNQRVRISFDDDPRDAVDMTINTVAVANGRFFGGGMQIAPEAELDDGFFDVVAVGDVGRGEFLRSSPRVYRGTHLSMDKVSHRRARVLRAEPIADAEIELDVDGETPGRLPATFTLLPRALKLLAPSGE